MTLFTDNTAANTSHLQGLVVLLERVRQHAYAQLPDPKPPYRPLTFKGRDCSHSVSSFDRRLVQYAQSQPSLTYFAHPIVAAYIRVKTSAYKLTVQPASFETVRRHDKFSRSQAPR